LIESLLHDIDAHCRAMPVELILTLNLDETLPFAPDHFSFPLNRTQLTDPKKPHCFNQRHLARAGQAFDSKG